MKAKALFLLAAVALILSPVGRAFADTTIYTTADNANSPDGVSARSAQQTTLTVQNTINNATSVLWTGYNVEVSMSHAFAIANPFVYNPGWTGAITQQPDSSNGYTGMIQYAMGSGQPIPNGQLLSYSYQLTFTGGSAAYMQNLVPVPEPTSLSLALGAGLLLAVTLVRRQKRSY